MTKVEELLAYFDRLIALTHVGNICQREIDEVVGAIRGELGLGATEAVSVNLDGKALAKAIQKQIRLDSRL